MACGFVFVAYKYVKLIEFTIIKSFLLILYSLINVLIFFGFFSYKFNHKFYLNDKIDKLGVFIKN